jgi:hypothetical protein
LSTGHSKESIFNLDEYTTDCRCSTSYLLNLIYNLSSSPIYRRLSMQDLHALQASFPFISYTLLWVDHAIFGFRAGSAYSQSRQADIWYDFYNILAKLINAPYTISLWIEVARTFQIVLSLESLTSLHIVGPCQTDLLSPFCTGKLAISLLEDLSVDLERLDQDCGYLLNQGLSAIWGPSISAFCKSSS